ncbi:MAG: winged helix-turn-helix transcriptional regulator [Candidatus Hodarchaeota archaeon]
MKKSQIRVMYFFLVLMLFFHSFQVFSFKNHLSQNGDEITPSCNIISELDILIMRMSLEINYGTSTCTAISFEVITNNQITSADIYLMTFRDLQLLVRTQLSQITSFLFASGELFGFGGPVHGVLLVIGTISIDTQKYRETKKELLRNRNRFIIKETINKDPGIRLREIQRTTNLAMGVIQYHIRYLESGDIESFRLGKCKHFFVSSAKFSLEQKVWFSLNRNQNIKRILDLLVKSTGQYSQKDLSQFTGNSKSLISYYVKILRLNGVIEVTNHQLQISKDFTKINHKSFCERI